MLIRRIVSTLSWLVLCALSSAFLFGQSAGTKDGITVNAGSVPRVGVKMELGATGAPLSGSELTQMPVSALRSIKERARFQLRFDAYNFPIKQPNYANPASVYDANNPSTFARITAVQGSYSNIGSGRPNFYAIGRFEF